MPLPPKDPHGGDRVRFNDGTPPGPYATAPTSETFIPLQTADTRPIWHTPLAALITCLWLLLLAVAPPIVYGAYRLAFR